SSSASDEPWQAGSVRTVPGPGTGIPAIAGSNADSASQARRSAAGSPLGAADDAAAAGASAPGAAAPGASAPGASAPGASAPGTSAPGTSAERPAGAPSARTAAFPASPVSRSAAASSDTAGVRPLDGASDLSSGERLPDRLPALRSLGLPRFERRAVGGKAKSVRADAGNAGGGQS